MRALHSFIGWTMLVLGLVVGAWFVDVCAPAQVLFGPNVGSTVRTALDVAVRLFYACFGWILAGAPTLSVPVDLSRAWRETPGDGGAPWGEGCALGAVRRHPWAPFRILWHPQGHRLVLGGAATADNAFLAAASAWRHALIYVDTQGASDRLDRDDVVRFAPGRIDTVRLNPLMMIRRGPHAWRDAYILAAGLLGADAAADVIATLAAVQLDHLHTAAPEARTLGGLRRRLLDREAALGALVHAVHVKGGDGVWRSDPEIARLMRIWAGDPPLARELLGTASRALVGLQDGRLTEATDALDLRLADVAVDGPKTIILEAPPGEAARYAPFFAALLGQLVSQLTDAVDTDVFGRRKTRRVLVAIDDPALIGHVPMLAQRGAVAPRCGLELLVRSQTVKSAVALFGASASLDAYPAIAAIGPLHPDTAATLSAYAKTRAVLRLRRSEGRPWSGGPVVDVARAPRLSPERLICAHIGDANILVAGRGVVRGRTLDAPRGRLRFTSATHTPPSHDWTTEAAPAGEIKALPARDAPASLPLFEAVDATEPEGPAPDRTGAVGKKLRAGLARGARSRRR